MTDVARRERVRLQKFLSDAGIASRRAAEELILEGRVCVNGAVVDALPAFVEPAADRVEVDGVRVRRRRHEYYLVHKPPGVVCTERDPSGRRRAVDLLPPGVGRMIVVGRLDAAASGLLLLTNDGDLAARVAHPRFRVPKVYRVDVRGQASDDLPERMRRGAYLPEGRARIDDARVVHRGRDGSALEVTLYERRNHELRPLLARLGHAVRGLKRIRIGPLSLRGLPVGAARRLTEAELRALRECVVRSAPRPGVESPRRRAGQLSRRGR